MCRAGLLRPFVLLAFLVHLCLLPLAEAGNRKICPDNFSQLAVQAAPAVVNICVTESDMRRGPSGLWPWDPGEEPPEKNDPPPDFYKFFEKLWPKSSPDELKDLDPLLRSVGSGVIVDASGLVLTVNRDLPVSGQIWVRIKGNKPLPARLIGSDQETDLALLKLKGKHNFSRLSLGNCETLKAGDWVLACGNPSGLGFSMTAGIVSAKGRSLPGKQFAEYIQTDAKISRQFRGGPLLNLKGEVVGINIVPEDGNTDAGFAVSSKLAVDVINQLKSSGKVVRGWLGLSVEALTPERSKRLGGAEKMGVLVKQVAPDSPAQRAGLSKGDVILRYQGCPINKPKDLIQRVAASKKGSQVTVTCLRDKKEVDFIIRISARPDSGRAAPPPGYAENLLGVKLVGVTRELKDKFSLPVEYGLMVVELDAGGPAGRAGLLRGDIICEASRLKITGLPDLQKILKGLKPGRGLMLKVNRGDKFFDTALDLP